MTQPLDTNTPLHLLSRAGMLVIIGVCALLMHDAKSIADLGIVYAKGMLLMAAWVLLMMVCFAVAGIIKHRRRKA